MSDGEGKFGVNLFRCGYLVDLEYWALYSHSLLVRLSIVVVVPLVGMLVVIGRLLWVGSFGASSITSVRRWCRVDALFYGSAFWIPPPPFQAFDVVL